MYNEYLNKNTRLGVGMILPTPVPLQIMVCVTSGGQCVVGDRLIPLQIIVCVTSGGQRVVGDRRWSVSLTVVLG